MPRENDFRRMKLKRVSAATLSPTDEKRKKTMAVTPVSGVDSVSTTSGEAAFDAAVNNAQGSEMTPELEDMMIEGAISIGGQMIIMPRANDILNEAMSDE